MPESKLWKSKLSLSHSIIRGQQSCHGSVRAWILNDFNINFVVGFRFHLNFCQFWYPKMLLEDNIQRHCLKCPHCLKFTGYTYFGWSANMADVCNNTLKSWTRETCQVLILLLIYSRNSFLRIPNFYGTNLADANIL